MGLRDSGVQATGLKICVETSWLIGRMIRVWR